MIVRVPKGHRWCGTRWIKQADGPDLVEHFFERIGKGDVEPDLGPMPVIKRRGVRGTEQPSLL